MSWEHAAASYYHLKDSELCGAPQLSARVAKLSYGKARRAEQFRKVSGQVGLGMLLSPIVFLKNTGTVLVCDSREMKQSLSTIVNGLYIQSIQDRFGTGPCFSPRPCWSHRWLRAMEAKLPELANWAKCLNQEDGSCVLSEANFREIWGLRMPAFHSCFLRLRLDDSFLQERCRAK